MMDSHFEEEALKRRRRVFALSSSYFPCKYHSRDLLGLFYPDFPRERNKFEHAEAEAATAVVVVHFCDGAGKQQWV